MTTSYSGFEFVEDDNTIRVKNLVYDDNTLSWVAATGSLTEGSSVTVTNFPATQAISAASLPAITLASQGNPFTSAIPVKDDAASTASLANVSSSASNVTLLVANGNRKMAVFYNDVDKSCYVKMGATASTSSFTIKMAAGGYFELPHPVYTGIIDGIWDAAPTGSMRVTEY